MKRTNWLWIVGVCAVGCLLGASHWVSPVPIHAQQNTGYYSDGTFYMTASVDVDSNYNLRVSSYMDVDFDDYEDIDEIEVDGYADQDNSLIGDGAADGDDYSSAAFSLSSNSPVAPGHEYGMESDGFACYDDGEGDCEFEYVGYTYASVNVATPTPQIASINPSSVNEGDQGTLTITGSNLVENAGDQLSLNYSGSGMPFTLTGTPSSSTASFSYDFTGYTPGTYTLSVTNNEGTSNSKTFTVNAPLNACSQSTVPNAVTLQISGLGNGSGTFTVSHPTVTATGATTSVSYGPLSTPSSVASSIAAAISRNYVHLGMTAQSNGPAVTVQSRSTFSSVSANSSGATFSIGTPSTLSCIVLPANPCNPSIFDYGTARPYSDGTYTTPRQHIINRHILGSPSPGITKYATLPGSTDAKFNQVKGYNITTWELGSYVNGSYVYTFPKITVLGIEFGVVGYDSANDPLYTNLFYLDRSTCKVDTSFPQ